MKTTINSEATPPKNPGINSYRPQDIKRWDVQRFLDAQAAAGPFKIPPMHFTEEENRRTDELLEQERQAVADGL